MMYSLPLGIALPLLHQNKILSHLYTVLMGLLKSEFILTDMSFMDLLNYRIKI